MTGLNDFIERETIFSHPENLSILNIYQDWYEKMTLEINKLKSVLPELIDIVGTHTFELDSKSSQRFQHEGHQRTSEQASLFTVQSRVTNLFVLNRNALKVATLELKENGFEGNLFEFLEIKPALQDCAGYEAQWRCLQSMVEKMTQKTSKASDLSAQWKAAFLNGKTTTDACLIPKNGAQAALAKELISSLSSEQLKIRY